MYRPSVSVTAAGPTGRSAEPESRWKARTVMPPAGPPCAVVIRPVTL
jgi:hypothetical protein